VNAIRNTMRVNIERVKKTVLTPTDALINLSTRIFKILRDPPQSFMIYLCFLKILRNARCTKEVLMTQHLFFSTINFQLTYRWNGSRAKRVQRDRNCWDLPDSGLEVQLPSTQTTTGKSLVSRKMS